MFYKAMASKEWRSGDDIWNISANFVNFRIFGKMMECDNLEIIAQFGIVHIDSEIPENQKQRRRIEALLRFKENLQNIFENTSFVIKKEDKEKFERLRKSLKFLDKYLKSTYKIKTNQITHSKEVVVVENLFNLCLNKLKKIKEELHIYLNNANIIFRQSGDIDLSSVIQDIEESG